MSLRSILIIACLLAVATATPRFMHADEGAVGGYHEELRPLARQIRSPGDGSVQIDYTADQNGRRAGVQYDQNIYKSDDGRLTVDAYARGSRDFDRNRNDYGGGIQGSYHFG